jgi:protein TonB
MIGNSDMDQMAAGEESPQQPPEEVTAEAVQPETVQPTEIKPEEVQPAEAEAVQPTETEAQPAEMAEVVQPTEQQQVLATQAPAETTVVQPAETVQPVEPTPEAVAPVEKPVRQEKPKEVVKKPAPKIAKAKSGSKGENQQDSKRGADSEQLEAKANTTSLANVRRTGMGDAARSNYDGKVRTCIKRAVRSSLSSEGGLTVVMRFTVTASGQVISPSVLRGSGDANLDQKVLADVRSARPCPDIPAELGASSLPFTIAVQVR